MTDREAFEAWYNQATTFAVQKDTDGTYMSALTRHYWTAWQAACKYKDEQCKIAEKVDH